MPKKLRNYLIAIVVTFLIVLLVGYFFVDFTWDESALLSAFLTVVGEARKDKAAKVETARNLWIPAINNHGEFGRWAFLEIVDPWDAKNTIRAFLKGKNVDGIAPMLQKD